MLLIVVETPALTCFYSTPVVDPVLPVQPALLPDHPRRALRRQVRQTLPTLIHTLHRMDRGHLVSHHDSLFKSCWSKVLRLRNSSDYLLVFHGSEFQN